MYIIDIEERKIIVTQEKTKATKEIREGEELNRIFLEGTEDTYSCVLKLLEVDIVDSETQEKTGEKEVKAFARRVDKPEWIMEFIEEEYNIFE